MWTSVLTNYNILRPPACCLTVIFFLKLTVVHSVYQHHILATYPNMNLYYGGSVVGAGGDVRLDGVMRF